MKKKNIPGGTESQGLAVSPLRPASRSFAVAELSSRVSSLLRNNEDSAAFHVDGGMSVKLHACVTVYFHHLGLAWEMRSCKDTIHMTPELVFSREGGKRVDLSQNYGEIFLFFFLPNYWAEL